MVSFNINNYVYVRLNKLGLAELKRQNDERLKGGHKVGEFEAPYEDAEGWSRWQGHSLMARFGHMMGCGKQLPFDVDIRIASNLSKEIKCSEYD